MKRPHAILSPVLLAAETASIEAPEWVHLLPTAAGAIQTDDRRGPYTVADAEAIIAASFAISDRLPIDQDHATDLAAPKGLPAPARGWITAMEARADGIWGKVEWTREGAALVADRAYRALSPVIFHDAAKKILAIGRASLVNRPNLKGLTALNSIQEETPDMDKIAAALGLQASAGEEDILSAIASMKKTPEGDPAPQASQVALQSAQDAVTALQATVAEQATQIKSLTDGQARKQAEAFIDQAIADKRAGLNAGTRDYFVSLHMADPEKTVEAIGKMPKLGPTGMSPTPPAALKDGEIALNHSQLEAARLLGIPAKDYAAALKADAEKEA